MDADRDGPGFCSKRFSAWCQARPGTNLTRRRGGAERGDDGVGAALCGRPDRVAVARGGAGKDGVPHSPPLHQKPPAGAVQEKGVLGILFPRPGRGRGCPRPLGRRQDRKGNEATGRPGWRLFSVKEMGAGRWSLRSDPLDKTAEELKPTPENGSIGENILSAPSSNRSIERETAHSEPTEAPQSTPEHVPLPGCAIGLRDHLGQALSISFLK